MLRVMRRVGVVALAVAVVAGACSSSGDIVVRVTMTEGAWRIEAPESSGPVRALFYDFVNDGQVEHQPVVARTELAADALPVVEGFVRLFDEEDQGLEPVPVLDTLAWFPQFPGDIVPAAWAGYRRGAGEPQVDGDGPFLSIAPGETQRGGAEIPEARPVAGRYVVFCNLRGHYEAGYYGSFEVAAA